MILDYKKILVKIIKNICLLLIIMFFILILTSIPKDFDIRYFRGNYESNYSFKEIFLLIEKNIVHFIKGEIGTVSIGGKLVKTIFKTSFFKSFIVLFFALLISIVLGSLLGVLIGIVSKNRRILNTLLMIPTSMPDVFTIAIIQFLALYLFKNNIKFLGIGPIEHKGDLYWYNAIFPIIAIAIIPIFYVTVTIIKTIESEYSKPYVLALRGKGLKRSYIIRVHMKKTIIYNIISIMPSLITIMFSSLIIVENLFYYRGVGYEMINIFKSTKVTPEEGQILFTYFLVMSSIFYFIVYEILNLIKEYSLPDLYEDS